MCFLSRSENPLSSDKFTAFLFSFGKSFFVCPSFHWDRSAFKLCFPGFGKWNLGCGGSACSGLCVEVRGQPWLSVFSLFEQERGLFVVSLRVQDRLTLEAPPPPHPPLTKEHCRHTATPCFLWVLDVQTQVLTLCRSARLTESSPQPRNGIFIALVATPSINI